MSESQRAPALEPVPPPRPAYSRAFLWAALILAVGAGLRTVRYAHGCSLWLDEAQLALNVLDRPMARLMEPLDYRQAAPVGFLALEKLAALAFGDGEHGLRLVPFLAGLLALPIFYSVARCCLRQGEALLALAFFALAEPAIHYSSIVKPYSADVVVSLVLLRCAFGALREGPTPQWTLLLLATGTAGVWISYPAVFVCAGAGLTLILTAWREGKLRAATLHAAVALVWTASFALDYLLVLRHTDESRYFAQFWQQSFPPVPPRSLADLGWPMWTFFGVFQDPGGFRLPGLAAAAFVLGGFAAFRKDRRNLALLVWPVLATLLAAVFRLYPFPTSDAAEPPYAGRVILFVTPILTMLVAAGVGVLFSPLDTTRRLAARVIVVLLMAPLAFDALVSSVHPPVVNDVGPLVDVLSRRSRTGDVLLLNERAAPTVEYYVRRKHGRSDLYRRGLVLVELKGKGDWREYQRQIDALKAGRTWVLYAHHSSWRSRPDETFVLHLLGDRGERQLEKRLSGASLHFYVPARTSAKTSP